MLLTAFVDVFLWAKAFPQTPTLTSNVMSMTHEALGVCPQLGFPCHHDDLALGRWQTSCWMETQLP